MRSRPRTGRIEGKILFIVRPHAKNLDNTLFLQYLIYEAALDVDSTRYRPFQIANKRFIRRGSLKRINGKDPKQSFDICPQT